MSASTPQEEDAIDFREVDKVLTEAAGMAGRWALFRKFLFDRLRVCLFFAPHPPLGVS